VSHNDTSDLARRHFADKVIASYQNSPPLVKTVFSDAIPYTQDGMETRFLKVDSIRLNNVMKAIGFALYFLDFGKSFEGEWIVFPFSLVNREKVIEGTPDAIYDELRLGLLLIDFDEKPTPHPEVFQYGLCYDADHKFIYRLNFYEGFRVYLVATSTHQ